MPSRDPWRSLYTNFMSPLFILQDNESSFSNWTCSSYKESLRHLTYLVERRWTSSSSFLSHGRHIIYGKVRTWYQCMMPLLPSLLTLAAFAHCWLGLSVSSTITPKSRWWLKLLGSSPFSWYWGLLSFACWQIISSKQVWCKAQLNRLANWGQLRFARYKTWKLRPTGDWQ